MKENVRLIPATRNLQQQDITEIPAKRRVAGYARVSTDKEEQGSSFDAQVDFYTTYIKDRDDWQFITVYTDEGISATSTAKREGFKRMISDALDGKLDLIITKSVSRFARNTVDTLTIVRQLKEKGVEVYFQKENIYTLDSKGELLITIMSSLAQEESRSISENVTWGARKRMQDGKISLPYARFLGYKKGKNGVPEIVESEAIIVRQIYQMFLQGKTINAIARHLTEQGVPTPGGKENWSVTTLKSILTNEKMKGDALLQKGYTVDFLSKKKRKNFGEVPQYYVEGSHPGIVTAEVFDLVQAEMKRRRAGGKAQSGLHPFSSRIVCGKCGQYFGPKTWHSTSKYKCTIWRCNNKYNRSGDNCQTPHLSEEMVQSVFVEAFNKFYSTREQLSEDYAAIIEVLTDTSALDEEAAAHQSECDVVAELIRKLMEENKRSPQDQMNYEQRRIPLIARYEAAKKSLDTVIEVKQDRTTKQKILSRFMEDIAKCDGLLAGFDEELWCETVDSVTVYSVNDVAVMFRDGSVVHVDASGK